MGRWGAALAFIESEEGALVDGQQGGEVGVQQHRQLVLGLHAAVDVQRDAQQRLAWGGGEVGPAFDLGPGGGGVGLDRGVVSVLRPPLPTTQGEPDFSLLHQWGLANLLVCLANQTNRALASLILAERLNHTSTPPPPMGW